MDGLTPTQLQLVVFLAILVGILLRAFSPYWRKLLEGEKLVFEMRYIAIVIVSFITAAQVFPNYTPVLDSILITVLSAIIFGFGLQAVYTEVYALVENVVQKAKTP